MKPSQILRLGKARLIWSGWGRYDYRSMEKGKACPNYCALGATWCGLSITLAQVQAENYLYDAVSQHLGQPTFVSAFNDDPATTKADVIALYDKAIKLAEAEGN